MKKLFQTFVIALALAISAVFLFSQGQVLGPYGNLPWTTGNTAADTATLSTFNMVGLLTGTPTAAANYTTPTATALCALWPFLAGSNAGPFSWDWVIKNTSAGANTITVVAGAGMTLRGTGTAAQNTVRSFRINLVGCGTGQTPAGDIFSLTTGAF